MSEADEAKTNLNDDLKAEEPATKKAKEIMEQAPDTEWPEAWLMPEGNCEDQKKPNKKDPNVPVTVEELKDLGIW